MASYGLAQIRYTRNRPSGQPPEDVDVNALHCQVTDGGWTSGDRDAFVSAFGTWWATAHNYHSDQLIAGEIRFYDLPATAGPSGDPAFTNVDPTRTGTAAQTSELPPQVSATITMQTAFRRHWGRIYMPTLAGPINSSGRINATAIGLLGPAFYTFATSLQSASLPLVIWNRTAWIPNYVTRISMDDVFDVQRRRRFDQPVTRYESAIL